MIQESRIKGTKQAGLTLVELMIGMALGLLVVAALGYLYVGNRQAYRTQDAVARIQENGRIAMEIVGRDLRSAGYMGCGNLADPNLNLGLLASTPPLSTWDINNIVRGFESDWGVDRNQDGVVNASDRPDGYVTNTDTFAIFTGGEAVFPLSSAMSAPSDDIPLIGNTKTFKEADLMLIADCTHVDVFRASADGITDIKHKVTSCTDATNGKTYNPCNTSDELSKAYGLDAVVMPVTASVYYLQNKAGGVRSLYRLPWSGGAWGTSEEVVEHVEAMQVVYGQDTNGNGSVDVYRKANEVTDWGRVLAVRVSLLLRSNEDNLATTVQIYSWDRDNDGKIAAGETVTATDRRLRYVYTTTIALRNRMLGMP